MLAAGCATKTKVAELPPEESGYGPDKLGVAEEKNFFGYKIQQVERPDGSTAELIWY